MVVHIIISGASSVGKTTLINQCLQQFNEQKKYRHYKFQLINEVARTVLRQLKLTGKNLEEFIEKKDLRRFVDVQEKIIEEQVKCFDHAENTNYLSDRTGFDALAYIEYYFNDRRAAQTVFNKDFFQNLIKQCQNALIFIVQPQQDLLAENDNMRLMLNYDQQMKYTEYLKFWFDLANLSYFVIANLDLNERVNFIQQHLEGKFKWNSLSMRIPLHLPFHLNLDQRRLLIRRVALKSQDELHISVTPYKMSRFLEKFDRSCENQKFIVAQFEKILDDELVKKILLAGIFLNGEHFNFVGSSNSQAKDRACYLYSGSIEEIQRMIDSCGNFQAIKSISKRAARIGLLFSSGTPTIHIENHQVIHIDDVERNGYVFTDG